MNDKPTEKRSGETSKELKKKEVKDLSPKKADAIKGGEKVEAHSENVRR